MAIPANKLDVFVTYIPHYELHVAGDWPALKAVETQDANTLTTPTQATDTLLINTRKDAHQQIDNVRFLYRITSELMRPVGTLSLDVVEPNGTSFIEKIQNVQARYHVSNIQEGLTFGLKIFFVGRTADGTDKTIPFSRIIPLNLTQLDAKFTHKGGEYHMGFNCAGSAAVTSFQHQNDGASRSIAYTNKTISLKSSTIQDAIKQLEQRLNQNYEDVYKTERSNPGAKPLTYKINLLDPEIAGNLHLSTKETYGDSEPCQFSFSNTTSIETMINQILFASKEMNEIIGGSRDTIFKEFHPNVKYPIIKVSYLLEPTKGTMVYDVHLYKGGRVEENVFEFFYYFSGPGKNVDVMNFDVRFPMMLNWMNSSKFSANKNTNNDSRIPSTDPQNYAKNITHEDTTRETIYEAASKQVDAPLQPGDLAHLPAANSTEFTGMAKYQAHAVP